ncbi:M12 family metallopeptidase [Achromobacter sp. AGC39]
MNRQLRWVGQWLLITFSVTGTAQSIPVWTESLVDKDSLWPPPHFSVPVCWENTNDFSLERRWVEESVYAHIEGVNREVSGLRFLNSAGARGGWSVCKPNSLGVRVTVDDSPSRSDVGRQWNRDRDGNKLSERATRMYLNFSFRLSPDDAWCRKEREHCIRAIAVHEFMHAVGFLHEQLRTDAPDNCKAHWAEHPDFEGYRPTPVTESYDADSHMNYCTNMYRRPLRLSLLDVATLRRLYPFN